MLDSACATSAVANLAGRAKCVTNYLVHYCYCSSVIREPVRDLQQPRSAASLQLVWLDNSSDETGFHVERKLGTAGTYSVVATTGANVTSYADSSLADSTTYCYRVNAFNGAGNSPYSPEACGTTPAAARDDLQLDSCASGKRHRNQYSIRNQLRNHMRRKFHQRRDSHLTGSGGDRLHIYRLERRCRLPRWRGHDERAINPARLLLRPIRSFPPATH